MLLQKKQFKCEEKKKVGLPQQVPIPVKKGTTGGTPYMMKFPKGTLISDVLKNISSVVAGKGLPGSRLE